MAKDVAIVQAQRLSGNVGDVLTKTENGVKWQAPQGGSGGGVPDGGEENNVLARDVDGGLKWMPLQDEWIVDETLDASSSSPVQNRAVANALAGKQDKLPYGSSGLFLMHGLGSDSYSWAAVLPEGGDPGDVLTRIGETGVGWAALDVGSPTGLIDSELDASSSNPVKNKAVYAGLELKQDKLPGGTAGKYLRMTDDGPAWLDASWSGAAVSVLPAGGTKGQVLARTSDSYSWIDALELPDGNVNDVLTLTGNGPAWAPLPAAMTGDVSSETVLALASKLDLNSVYIRGGARIYIGKNKNLDTRSDSVPEIDFLHTKDAMLGHEYCAVFTFEAVDQDVKPSATVFPWVPWPVEDGEWSSSESSLSISDPWADHPNMGEGTYEYLGPMDTSVHHLPSLKGTGFVYPPSTKQTGDMNTFFMGEPVVDPAALYGKWTKHVSLVIDASVQGASQEHYGQYVWDAESARYLCEDSHKKIIPYKDTTYAYAWAVVDMSDSDNFPEATWNVYGATNPLPVRPENLRSVIWERSVDDKYVYRTVLRDDKKYSVAVADVDPACDGGGGGGSGASCDCAAELDAIKYQLMSMELELMELWALHSIAKLTVAHTPGDAPAGAAWDVDSDSNWHAFGTPIPLEAGTHSIGFKLIDGYTAPASQPVSLTAGERKTVTASYTDNTSKLTVTFSGDAPSGAFWSVAPASAHTSVSSYAYGASAVLAPGSYVVRPFGYAEYDTFAAGYTRNDGLLGYPVTLAPGDQADIEIVYLGEKAAQPATAPYTVSDAPAEVSGDYELNGSAAGYGGTPVYVNDSGYYMYKVRDDDNDDYWVIQLVTTGINTHIDQRATEVFSYYVQSSANTPPTSGWTGCTVTAN